MELTIEQKAAVYEKGDILVSAAAGSGKTAVLVKRIINLITKDEPVDMDRLLVVTFTNAAAAQMKQRLRKALKEQLLSDPENVNLNRQMSLINQAQITTLHSFCLTIIRRFFYKAGVDPQARTLDQTESDIIKAQVIEELFEGLYESQDEGFLKLVACYSQGVEDTALQNIVLKLHSFTRSCPDPKSWLSKQQDEEFENSIWYQSFVSSIEEEIKNGLSFCEKALSLSRVFPEHSKLFQTIKSDYEFFINLADNISHLQNFFVLLKVSLPKFPAFTKKEDPNLRDIRDEIKEIRDRDIKGSLKTIKEILFKDIDSLKKDFLELRETVHDLSRLVLSFSELYQNEKKRRNVVDFSDYEHMCLEILYEDLESQTLTKEALEIRDGFYEILIDEYQDINAVQELILTAVSGRDGVKNRFMVGDIKQSIYKFRLADPSIFTKKYESFPLLGSAEDSESKLINLSKNFRSRDSVLSSVNFLFTRIMSKSMGDIDYDERQALYPGISYPPAETNFCKTDIYIINQAQNAEIYDNGENEDSGESDTKSDFEKTKELLEEYSKFELEARLCGEKIRQMIDSGQTVFVDGITRQVQYSDFVILLRSPSTTSEIFERELKRLYIPSLSGISGDYFSAYEVMTVLNLLSIIDNPRQDIPLISVLYSPILGLSADELVKISAYGSGIFYERSINYAETFQDETALKLKSFFENLSAWREKAVFMPVNELIWDLYESTGYFEAVAAMENGVARQKNLITLFEKACAYAESNFSGLFKFIIYMDELKKKSAPEAPPSASESGNFVRIMSIHKSKGLEFPVVLVCGLGKQANLMDLSNPVLAHSELGLGLMHYDLERRIKSETLKRMVIKQKLRQEILSEELRILYVALTRAKEKLILIGTLSDFNKSFEKFSGNDKEKVSPNLLLKSSIGLEWFLGALINGGYEKSSDEIKKLFNIEIISKSDYIKSEKMSAVSKIKLYDRLLNIPLNSNLSGKREEVEKSLSLQYLYEKASYIPSKLSVSEIKRMYYNLIMGDGDNDESQSKASKPIIFEKPSFMSQRPPTASEIGQATHGVLEHIPLEPISRDGLNSLIDELRESGKISEEEALIADRESIFGFIQSEIFKRMMDSKAVWREYPFIMKIDSKELFSEEGGFVLAHGIIDCLFEEPEGLILLDYKTDRFPDSRKQEVVDGYRTQLNLYKRAVVESMGKDVAQCILYFLSRGEYIIL